MNAEHFLVELCDGPPTGSRFSYLGTAPDGESAMSAALDRAANDGYLDPHVLRVTFLGVLNFECVDPVAQMKCKRPAKRRRR